MTDLEIVASEVHSAPASAILRAYFADVASRYYRRAATPAELDTAMTEDPSDVLSPPSGVFLLAREGTDAVGCAGVRLLEPGVAELKRMFVRSDRRGRGIGARLLSRAEDSARDLGANVVRLDTRRDLVEARSLYAHHGYREIPGYNDGPYAECWYERRLADT